MSCSSHQRVIKKILLVSHFSGQGVASLAMPLLVQSVAYNVPNLGDCASFQANACSRPPPPMRSTLHDSGHGFGACIPGIVTKLVMFYLLMEQ